MLFLTILVFITLALKGGMYIYYFKYYLNEPAIASFLENIGFNKFTHWLYQTTGFQWPDDPATSGNSLFNASGIIFMIAGNHVIKTTGRSVWQKGCIWNFSFSLCPVFIIVRFLFTRFYRYCIHHPDSARILLWRYHSTAVGHDCRCRGL